MNEGHDGNLREREKETATVGAQGTGDGRARLSLVDSPAAGTAIEAENDTAAPKETETEATGTGTGAKTRIGTALLNTKARCLHKKPRSPLPSQKERLNNPKKSRIMETLASWQLPPTLSHKPMVLASHSSIMSHPRHAKPHREISGNCSSSRDRTLWTQSS